MKEAGIADLINSGEKVFIKPNLVEPKPASYGSTTHPEIVEGIIQYLKNEGRNNIFMFESTSVGFKTKDAIKACGYDVLSNKYDVPFIDLDNEAVISVDSEGMALNIYKAAAQAGFIINVPVMKGHCQTDITCCLKNMKGLIPFREKSRFHSMGLHRPIAALASRIRPAVHIVDAICGDPTFELGGKPLEFNRIMLGFDPVLLDSFCAELLGYRPDEIRYIKYAKDYGVGSYKDEKTQIIELNTENKPKAINLTGTLAGRYKKYIEEDGACSPCYAALITALNKLGNRIPSDPIKIGQGFRGVSSDGIGVGNCTSGCKYSVKGCPPSAVDMVDLIRGIR